MTTNEDITIYNCRLDEETRREAYYPTVIRGVSYHESIGESGSPKNRSEASGYEIRIPLNADTSGREYVDAGTYRGLSDASGYWTIQEDDLIRIGCYPGPAVYLDELRDAKYMIIGNHADNTKRGSRFTRHWRISCGKE